MQIFLWAHSLVTWLATLFTWPMYAVHMANNTGHMTNTVYMASNTVYMASNTGHMASNTTLVTWPATLLTWPMYAVHMLFTCTNTHCSHMRKHTQVCGGDGVTYKNLCVLQSQANTRLDYRGECGGRNVSREQHCQNIRNSNRCIHNSNNCQQLVQPGDGCCPICGKCYINLISRP